MAGSAMTWPWAVPSTSIFTLIRPSMSLKIHAVVLEMRTLPRSPKELDGVKVLFSHALTVGMLIGSKEPITSLADFKARRSMLGDYQSPTSCAPSGLGREHPYGRCVLEYAARRHRRASCDYDLLVSAVWATWSSTSPSSTHHGLVFAVMNKDVYDGCRTISSRSSTACPGSWTYPLQGVLERSRYSLNTWVSDMGGTGRQAANYAEADRLTEPSCGEWIDIVTKAGSRQAIESEVPELETLRQAVEPVLHRHRRQVAASGMGGIPPGAPRELATVDVLRRDSSNKETKYGARIPTEQVSRQGRPRCSRRKPQMAQRGGHGRLHARGVLTFVDVFLRYWFGKSINGTVESRNS